VTRVALARTPPSYAGLRPPFGPGKSYPELAPLLGGADPDEPPNPVYAALRSALHALGLDAGRFGGETWNPLGELVHRGGRVVLKPNFIRHWNPQPGASLESVVTHGAILRAVADYAFLAVGTAGSVIVAEAPQQDCSFREVGRATGLPELVRFYGETLRRDLEVIDLRREEVSTRDGVIVERRGLPGDPRGYRVVDVGKWSFFADSGLDPRRFRGADYDPAPTSGHHEGGRHEYLLSETVLGADLVVNLPKLKTHKKTGVTLALKNLVGINGDKNWLPHHCLGSESEGGDEFPGARRADRWRSRATELARGWLARGRGVPLVRLARRAEFALRGDQFVRSGNWYGNCTTWRMCLDLNRGFYYSDARGLHLDAERPVRVALHVLDGVVAGEGGGPLAPRDRPLGVVLASLDPLALDLAAVRLMGFDEERISKIREAMRAAHHRFSAVRGAADVEIVEVDAGGQRRLGLEDLRCQVPFLAHPGWRGHIERAQP
jgi:uncharacterized protein (DUF362 family)